MEPPSKRQHLSWHGEDDAASKQETVVREAWEYLKKDDFGSGNFFDFNKF